MRALHFLIPASLLVGAFLACGGDDSTPTGGTAGSGGATSGTAGSGGASGNGGTAGSAGTGGAGGSGGAGATGSVLQHHNHATRDGVYVDAAFTKDAVATMHIDTTFASATYSGPVTAHPLYLAGTGTASDLVIIASNQNHVFAFDAASGAQVWDQAVGTPLLQSNLAVLKTGGSCGNVNPLGVMGTPVIDGATRTIYLDAMQLNGGTAQHMVYALDADTGMPRSGWPVDLNAKAKSGAIAFYSLAQNQRGALALIGGRVLIPFGGHIGDCGDYHGWVVSISTSDPNQIASFATRAIGGGIWAHGALASDGISVYFATGNTMSATNTFSAPSMYGDGESVFKLPPDLKMTGATTEYFVPTNWAALDNSDADIGGTGPLPIDLPGSTPSKAILQFGKDGKAYLIDRDTMGGQSAPAAVATVTSGQRAAIITAPVVYTTPMATYAVIKSNAAAGCPAGQTGTLRAIKITTGAPPTMEVVWCSGAASAGAPAVTMTDATGANTLVWLIGDDNKLRAHDGDTGAVVFNGGADTLAAGTPFRAPIFVKGRAFATSTTQLYALKP